MITKDLAYSCEVLRGYLLEMRDVHRVSQDEFTYKDAKIKLQRKGRGGPLNIERSYMYLSGDTGDIEEFYNHFLVHYMTMGG